MTLDEVALVAGVGKSSLYARFAGKTDLVAAALASLQRDGPVSTGQLRADLVLGLCAAEQDLGRMGPQVLAATIERDAGARADGLLAARARHLAALFDDEAGEAAAARHSCGPRGPHADAVALLVGSLLLRVFVPALVPEPWPGRAVDAALALLRTHSPRPSS